MKPISLNEWTKQIHALAIEKGWWEDERSFGDIIALCHSELSEALEEDRNSTKDRIRSLPIYYSGGGYVADFPTECCKKPEGVAVELADCIIRILDYCGEENIDIENVMQLKMEFNENRPYKHGGKKY